jgi:hypothetical protein
MAVFEGRHDAVGASVTENAYYFFKSIPAA